MPRAGPGNQPTQKRPTMACNFIMSLCPPLYADMTMKTPRNCSAAHLKSRRNRLLLSRITFDHGPCPSSHASCRARRNLPRQNCDNCTNASCGARESALQGGISSCRSGGDGGACATVSGRPMKTPQNAPLGGFSAPLPTRSDGMFCRQIGHSERWNAKMAENPSAISEHWLPAGRKRSRKNTIPETNLVPSVQ